MYYTFFSVISVYSGFVGFVAAILLVSHLLYIYIFLLISLVYFCQYTKAKIKFILIKFYHFVYLKNSESSKSKFNLRLANIL